MWNRTLHVSLFPHACVSASVPFDVWSSYIMCAVNMQRAVLLSQRLWGAVQREHIIFAQALISFTADSCSHSIPVKFIQIHCMACLPAETYSPVRIECYSDVFCRLTLKLASPCFPQQKPNRIFPIVFVLFQKICYVINKWLLGCGWISDICENLMAKRDPLFYVNSIAMFK